MNQIKSRGTAETIQYKHKKCVFVWPTFQRGLKKFVTDFLLKASLDEKVFWEKRGILCGRLFLMKWNRYFLWKGGQFLSCFCCRCDEPCSPGTHGVSCNSSCHCQNGGTCHPVSGSCYCPRGWEVSCKKNHWIYEFWVVNIAEKVVRSSKSILWLFDKISWLSE